MAKIIEMKSKPSQVLNLGIFLTFFLVVTLPLIFIRWRSLNSTEYILTEDEIVFKRNFIDRESISIKIEEIENVFIEQPFFLKLFSLSNLIITAEQKKTIIFSGIKNAESLLITIQEKQKKKSSHNLINTGGI